MAEPINIPAKTTGDSLTAAEFNEVVDKINAAITELNGLNTIEQ